MKWVGTAQGTVGVRVGALTATRNQPSARPGSVVPELGDVGVVLIGTLLCLLVICAIIAAHLRTED